MPCIQLLWQPVIITRITDNILKLSRMFLLDTVTIYLNPFSNQTPNIGLSLLLQHIVEVLISDFEITPDLFKFFPFFWKMVVNPFQVFQDFLHVRPSLVSSSLFYRFALQFNEGVVVHQTKQKLTYSNSCYISIQQLLIKTVEKFYWYSVANAAQNTEISPNSLVWKFGRNAQFPQRIQNRQKLYGN